jgi:hypothetical protein
VQENKRAIIRAFWKKLDMHRVIYVVQPLINMENFPVNMILRHKRGIDANRQYS